MSQPDAEFDPTPQPLATMTPPAEVDLDAPIFTDIAPEEAKDLDFEHVPDVHKRAVANTARRHLMTDSTFLIAVRTLALMYQEQFSSMTGREPNYERQCVRAQVAMSVIGDIVGQLDQIAANGDLDPQRVRTTVRGTE